MSLSSFLGGQGTASAYMVTGGEWTSSTISWDNMPAANTLLEDNISHNNLTKYQFSCLTAVQHWYDGDITGQNENYGVMVRYYDETIADYNSVFSADYTVATQRPTLRIFYNPLKLYIDEGISLTLTPPATSEEITWATSKPSVATVTSAGYLTCIKAGSTTVTASVGDTVVKEYDIYVTKPDGVYYINSGGFYIGTCGYVADGTNAVLQSKSTSGRAQLNQLWRIDHLSECLYSIRPLYKMDMGLTCENGVPGAVEITTIGTGTDNVPNVNKWEIVYDIDGYVFRCAGTSVMTMCRPNPTLGSTVETRTLTSSLTEYKWSMEPVTTVANQVLLTDTQTGETATGGTYYINPGETWMPEDVGIAASVVSAYSQSQYIEWLSSAQNVISIDKTTGQMTGLQPGGSATITARHNFNGSYAEAHVTVVVRPVVDGTYFIRSRAYNRYMQIDDNDSSNNYTTSGAIMEQWAFDGGDYQKWTFTHLDDGYYKIVSARSGKALSVASGETASKNVSLVQETYYGYDRQKWKITITDSGYYKIKAKSSEGLSDDLVMAVGYSLVNDSDGVNIEQREYYVETSYDVAYYDDWLISPAINIGMSTDNYSGGEDRGRGSYTYATTFANELKEDNPVTFIHHYNMDSTHTASKNDFAANGAISNDIDFMIYIGHGHSITNCRHNPNVNHIQYSHATDGTVNANNICAEGTYSQEKKDKFCLYVDDVHFGSAASDLRWVWMYTCYFLSTNEYVTNDDLREMMTGAHIVMGYATQSYLCNANAELFAQYLQRGETIINAFVLAGKFGEATCTNDNHIQKIMYIPQAEKETIYSPNVHYEYDSSDVLIVTSCIQDQNS